MLGRGAAACADEYRPDRNLFLQTIPEFRIYLPLASWASAGPSTDLSLC
jgi:hypothetical protein